MEGHLNKADHVAYLVTGSPNKIAVARVTANIQQERKVLAHLFRAKWGNISTRWKPVYIKNVEEGDQETYTVTPNPRVEPLLYASLVLSVQLLVEGEMCLRS